MEVSIIGTGYIGLTTGAALAYLGHRVVCHDIDEKKIRRLKEGQTPFYEPWLEKLMSMVKARLSFTHHYPEAISKADIVFISVGTPSLDDGSTDLSQLRNAVWNIGRCLEKKFTVIVTKSTVPIGSGNWVEATLSEVLRSREDDNVATFSIAANPEFLREGSALFDTFYPDRIVIGSDDPRALQLINDLYQPIGEQSFVAPDFLPRPENIRTVPILSTSLASAEIIKYAANAFLALKISFINEISQLSEKFKMDIFEITQGIGLDSRIGGRFLEPGVGWGGSCFGKDTAALIAAAQEFGIPVPIVRAARDVNYQQRKRVVEKLVAALSTLKERTVGLLGLAFKPHTDDVRDAPALEFCRQLTSLGAKVKVHDPVAMPNAEFALSGLRIEFCERPEEVAAGADALLLVTEWPEYRELPWELIAKQMKAPLILDGRNYLDRDRMKRAGFNYMGIGR
ncbi:MAG: UDP-glucose/GDP-mannose dehydrogenase family protein [bacterium]